MICSDQLFSLHFQSWFPNFTSNFRELPCITVPKVVFASSCYGPGENVGLQETCSPLCKSTAEVITIDLEWPLLTVFREGFTWLDN